VTVALAHALHGPGDGPLVVLLHSIGTDRTLWDAHVPGLVAAGRRVAAVDLRGHGGSPVLPGPYAVAELGDDVVGLLDELGAERADVVGVSLGGAIALSLALRHPARVGRIAVCCSAASFGGPGTWAPRAATARAEGVGPLAEGTVGRWFTPGFRREQPDRVATIRGVLERTDPEGYAASCDALGALDLRPRLRTIRAPTLVVAGAHDVATPPEATSVPMAAAIPGARLQVVDAAHLAPYERPDLVGPLVLQHLDPRSAP
jgi:3-oxoadipate enol-lactonase